MFPAGAERAGGGPVVGGSKIDLEVEFLTKRFRERFVKCVLLFHETIGIVSLVSLFREIARFGEISFVKQRNSIIILRKSGEKHLSERAVEGTKGHQGCRGLYRG
jgi:hypothetical protein